MRLGFVSFSKLKPQRLRLNIVDVMHSAHAEWVGELSGLCSETDISPGTFPTSVLCFSLCGRCTIRRTLHLAKSIFINGAGILVKWSPQHRLREEEEEEEEEEED